MRVSPDFRYIDLTVTVSGGEGETFFKFNGSTRCVYITVTPPNGVDTYDAELEDANGKLVDGAEGLLGESTIDVDKPIPGNSGSVVISNAADGDYSVRLVRHFGA